MSSKTYEQKVARLVQEATGAAYITALRWTNEHVATHPDRMTKEERALAITESRITAETMRANQSKPGGW